MFLTSEKYSTDFAFLDSGTGGIPYLVKLKEMCPGAKCVYIGDTANFPYGEKSHDEIVKSLLKLVKKVREKCRPKIIVLACNTMSVNGLDEVRAANPDIKFVGTVPAIKLAATVSKKRRIGLLATNSTIKNPYNQELKNAFAFDCELISRGDPDLISFVEHKYFSVTPEETKTAIKPAVDYFREKDCDVIILGCTHFLNIADEIQEVAGSDIKVVDSRDGVVNHAIDVAGMKDFCSSKTNQCVEKDRLYVTGFSDKDDENEYNIITSRYGMEFCGKL